MFLQILFLVYPSLSTEGNNAVVVFLVLAAVTKLDVQPSEQLFLPVPQKGQPFVAEAADILV